jgi:hypothetical protein
VPLAEVAATLCTRPDSGVELALESTRAYQPHNVDEVPDALGRNGDVAGVGRPASDKQIAVLATYAAADGRQVARGRQLSVSGIAGQVAADEDEGHETGGV